MALTELSVRKLRSKSSRYEVADGGGLYLRIMPTGAKSWIFRYVFDERPRRMTIGRYPGLGLTEARQKHLEAVAEVQRGIDPGAEARAAKQRRKVAPTFGDLVAEFWERELSSKRSGNQSMRLLENDALPSWHNRKVADLKRRDVVLLLDDVADRAPITRNRLHSALTRIFNFAAERGHIDNSPCTRIKKLPEVSKERVLSDKEIKAFWEATDPNGKNSTLYRQTRLILRLILLTGQRPGEVGGMAWMEIDHDSMTWTIPAARIKGGEDHVVPLCPLAWAMIQEAQRLGDGADDGLVFTSSKMRGDGTRGGITRHGVSRAVARHWKALGAAEKFSPHDLRRTLRTKLAELGVDDIHAERLLGHKLQGMLRIYNQHPYLDEKRAALLKWEARLQEIAGGETKKSNVIPMRRKA